MICPVCKATGFITVRSGERVGKDMQFETAHRACPMGCKPVASDRLKGNEMSLEEMQAIVGKPKKRKPSGDYKGTGVTHSFEEWYGLKED